MHINDRLEQFQAVAVNLVGGFVKRHKRKAIGTAATMLIAGPLLTGTGAGTITTITPESPFTTGQ